MNSNSLLIIEQLLVRPILTPLRYLLILTIKKNNGLVKHICFSSNITEKFIRLFNALIHNSFPMIIEFM